MNAAAPEWLPTGGFSDFFVYPWNRYYQPLHHFVTIIPDGEKPVVRVISYDEIMAGLRRLKSPKEEKFFTRFLPMSGYWNSPSLRGLIPFPRGTTKGEYLLRVK
jgi:hypothetical protein